MESAKRYPQMTQQSHFIIIKKSAARSFRTAETAFLLLCSGNRFFFLDLARIIFVLEHKL